MIVETDTLHNGPLTQSYFTGISHVYAGEYPGDKYGEKAEAKIRQMVHFGVRHFVDLTEEGELRPYAYLLPEGTTYTRFPIHDCSIPKSVDDVYRLIDKIKDLSKRDDGFVYIHCWGGVGRTGTIVACLLAEEMENPTFENAIKNLRSRFSEMPKAAHRVTPDTKEQERFIRKYVESVLDRRDLRKNRVRDCIQGCLMAGAAGDALGYPVEFMSRKSILSQYGDEGVTQFVLDCNGKALVSDDTQMTLFTANGLLNWWENENRLRGASILPFVGDAYVDWYFTQTGRTRIKDNGQGCHYTWLRHLPELSSRRAPGTTCMSACESLVYGDKPQNNSKGCGGIMRVAPLGLFQASYFSKNGKMMFKEIHLAEHGANIAKITHQHPLGYLPAALLTVLIARITLLTPEEVKASIIDIVKETLQVVMQLERNECLEQLTNKAMKLAMSDLSDADAIMRLGEGWTGDEAWAISLFCAIRHLDNVKDAIIAAVNHDGDSDSTGSICGNIMGAIYGYEAIKNERMFCPNGKELEDTLELSNIILAIADDLTLFPHVTEYSQTLTHDQAERWYQRYCKMNPAG